ncbi:nuclear transport factor 2 family protein [Shewanella sp. VB17]|uniref:nuclear transport factor 2 family protein n=1 Tax=Shewanella sp. VB17 TaxID=2739432 RepID=UPI001562F7EF|nr:nuclear transport factor 2 family protein [Shewanella sp. VB17]NRD73050.1 nuclear transport factor 2 family protein [Shewanella sp. VB17]
MKIFRNILVKFILIIAYLSAVAQAESVINKEHQAVVETAYNYFNGLANANQELIAKALDMDFGHAKIVSLDEETGKETIKIYTFKEFATFFKKPNDTWTAKILSVDIVGDTMAMVKMDFDTPKNNYIDYLVMYKREQGWRIISKTFSATKK